MKMARNPDTKFGWYLREALKKVWVRVAGFAFLAFFAAMLARILSPYLPQIPMLQTGSQSVSQLLGVLTSSMLAVTTFSLSIAVSAFTAASGTATPRATVLLQQDRTTQNVLATFLGAFVFGLIGIIALQAELYDQQGKVIVFAFTVVVIGIVVVALIGWIGHLMAFGRMSDILDRVEHATTQALQVRLERPFLGGQRLVGEPPTGNMAVRSDKSGYIQHIDMTELQTCAETLEAKAYLHCLPGTFTAPGTILLSLDAAEPNDEHTAALRNAVTIGANRSYEEDPRFGLIVMTEIASRALSPAVNDPGTAIDILGRHIRIFSQWRIPEDAEVRFDRVYVAPLDAADAIVDAFRPIARDGAALVEVQIRLQKSLSVLSKIGPDLFGQACIEMSQDAIERAKAVPLSQKDLAAVRAAAPSAWTRKGTIAIDQ